MLFARVHALHYNNTKHAQNISQSHTINVQSTNAHNQYKYTLNKQNALFQVFNSGIFKVYYYTIISRKQKGVGMKTEIIVKEDCVVLSRFIDRKLYNIEFSIDVKCADVAPYFNMSDDLFKQFVRREGI